MDIIDTHGVLSSQSRRSSHGIAAMGAKYFLICFEAAVTPS